MSIKTFLYGLGLGAGFMYLYDPERGNRRRALIRDQWVGFLNDTDDLIGKGTRDLGNRARGFTAEMRGLVTGEQATDEVIAERVRSKIGTVASHPRAIQVSVNDGRVTLKGLALASDVQPLLARVALVRGVTGIDNQLEVHDEPGNVPGLQGEPAQAGRTQGAWSPGIRLLAAASGGMMALSGLRRGGIMGRIRLLFGLALFARGATNRDLRGMVGLSDSSEAVTVRKGILVDAPVQEVFRFWQNYDNFSKFMSHVREVRDLGNGRSHWVVDGPAGTPVEWDATITNMTPDQMIAWESVPGSMVKQSGLVRFAPADAPRGGTHVNVQMSYTPPAGIIGHAVASFFGVNPKQAMDEDLLRFKTLVEQGKTSAHDREVTRDQVYQSQPQKGGSQQGTQAGRAQPAGQSSRADVSQGTPPGASKMGSTAGSRPGSAGAGAGGGGDDSGLPGGGAGRTDRVGDTGVYPASDLEEAPEDAQAQGMASWGQGDRGAAGYEDSGSSDLSGLGEETDFGSVIPGPDEE